MKKTFFTTLYFVLFLFPAVLFGQQNNGLMQLSANDIEFDSPAEKAEFEKLENNQQPDYIKLLFYSGGEYNTTKINAAKQQLSAFAEELKGRRFHKKSPQKKVKKVYEQTHETFFKKYELQHHFKDVFDDGTFNCVSGTAMFALLFDSLSIPYEVKEQPTHVYLITYPNEEKIEVEATTPTEGYTTYSDDFKKSFAKKLRDLKLISEEEYSTFGPEAIFDLYYHNDSTINFRQLVGLQYHNEAVYSAEGEDFESAMKFAGKAFLLYPCQLTEYTYRGTVANYLLSTDISEKKHLKYVEILSRIKEVREDEEQQKALAGVLDIIWNKKFITKEDPAFFDTACRYMQTHIEDSATRSLMATYCNLQRGEYYAKKGEFDIALPYLKAGYLLRPENEDVRQLYYAAYLTSCKNIKESILLAKLDSIVAVDTMYMENKLLSDAYLELMAAVGSEEFIYGDAKKGLELLERFESIYNTITYPNVSNENITRLYGDASVYYFRKGQRKKAKEFLERGLKLAPNSNELKHRLRSIK